MTQELMYGRRRFGSKLLAIALALVLCVGFFPGGLPSASAADDSDAITVTVSFGHGGESGFPLAPQRFTIQPGLSESYGYDDEFAGEKVSMLDAVVAAHEAVFGDGLTDELTVGGGGFVTRIMGVDSSSNLFFANGELPGDGEGLMYSVVQAEL
ncbi:MAG: hypothetical protein LBD12_01625, partial [Clostridiales Family XIII bacterium]|nr:hypothetical protein [Clostridiales Family XIII bacterium]